MEKKESTNNLIFVKNWVSFYFHLMSQHQTFSLKIKEDFFNS